MTPASTQTQATKLESWPPINKISIEKSNCWRCFMKISNCALGGKEMRFVMSRTYNSTLNVLQTYYSLCSSKLECEVNKVNPWSQYWLIAAGAYPGFCSMKRLIVFLLSLHGMLVHRRSLPLNLLGFPNNSLVPIYTPGWREALWELSVRPKNTTQCPLARARTQTAWSRDEHTNHEATAPPT